MKSVICCAIAVVLTVATGNYAADWIKVHHTERVCVPIYQDANVTRLQCHREWHW